MLVLFEEIRSQNRATLEAVEASRTAMETGFEALSGEHRADFGLLHAAIQAHTVELGQIKADIASLREQVTRLDAVITVDYRERLHQLEERVRKLEERSA